MYAGAASTSFSTDLIFSSSPFLSAWSRLQCCTSDLPEVSTQSLLSEVEHDLTLCYKVILENPRFFTCDRFQHQVRLCCESCKLFYYVRWFSHSPYAPHLKILMPLVVIFAIIHILKPGSLQAFSFILGIF